VLHNINISTPPDLFIPQAREAGPVSSYYASGQPVIILQYLLLSIARCLEYKWVSEGNASIFFKNQI